jgi:cytochrome c-type biogenesis protein CcmF
VRNVTGPNYVAARATISVTRGGKPVTVLYPEKRLYMVQRQPMTEAAISPGPTRDLYVSMGDQLEGGGWLIKVQHKPFVDWIWGGCVIMAIGGFLAASDRRYRFSTKSSPSVVPAGIQA